MDTKAVTSNYLLGKNIDCNSSQANDIIPVTPDIQKTKKPQIPRKQWLCSGEIFISEAESANFITLKNPVSLAVEKVYVFHSFREILSYTSQQYTVNNYLKIIGQYKSSQYNIPYVQGYNTNDRKFLVFVNTKMIKILPKFDDIIEIYGHLNFRTIMRKDVPIIVVHFFNAVEAEDILDYTCCLKKQKKFIPECCLMLNKAIEEVEDSLVDFLQNLSTTIISIEEE